MRNTRASPASWRKAPSATSKCHSSPYFVSHAAASTAEFVVVGDAHRPPFDDHVESGPHIRSRRDNDVVVAGEVLRLLLVWAGAHVHGGVTPDGDHRGDMRAAIGADGREPVDRGVGEHRRSPVPRRRCGARTAVGHVELDGRVGGSIRHARYRPPPTSELIAACSSRVAVALPPRRVDGRKVLAVGAIAGPSIDQLADDVGVSGVATGLVDACARGCGAGSPR